jgi:ribose transport system permease protein
VKVLKKIFGFRESTILLVILAFAVVLSISRPPFLSSINLFGILYSISVNSIIIGAMTVLFVSGGFDMSVGSILGLSGIIVGVLMVGGMPIVPAVLITIVLGIVMGAVQGFFISYLAINPFIVTLAGWFVYGALIFIVGKGSNINGFPKSFGLISFYKVAKVPVIIIFAIVTIIIFEVLLRKNFFFRSSFYIGGNESAAELVGIPVKKIKLTLYILTGATSAIAGIFLTSRFMAAYNVAGSENAFQIITAVIIGGASLKGGRGSVLGSFLGLIFVALIYDALVLYNINIQWNKFFIGVILVVMVMIDEKVGKRTALMRG